TLASDSWAAARSACSVGASSSTSVPGLGGVPAGLPAGMTKVLRVRCMVDSTKQRRRALGRLGGGSPPGHRASGPRASPPEWAKRWAPGGEDICMAGTPNSRRTVSGPLDTSGHLALLLSQCRHACCDHGRGGCRPAREDPDRRALVLPELRLCEDRVRG